jgi:hypothetical protein
MNVQEAIEDSLGLIGDEDIYERIYRHFYQSDPGAEPLMAHMDELTKGRMMEEVTRLLLSEDIPGESGYLIFELSNHKLAYSVEANMYDKLFESFLITLKSIAGKDWRAEHELAWRTRIEELSAAMSTNMPDD